MNNIAGLKIAFYYGNFREEIDYSKPTHANPGIGGAQFLIWITSSFFKEQYPEVEIYLFGKGSGNIPSMIHSESVSGEEECIKRCKELEIDYLVLRGPFLRSSVCDAIEKYGIKIILWSHNFENYVSLKRMEQCPHIVKNICVSNEQRDWLRDTGIYGKSATIYNGICFEDYDKIEAKGVPYRVCYIGNLYPRSGIESVIKAWPWIEKIYPQAELWIIGGNNLYNASAMKNAYSKKSFVRLERKAKKVFCKKDGSLKSNVHFTGVLGGMEKLKLMASAQVGIANITLAGDTFGLGAVEFQALGVPVVSVKRYGVRETVLDGKTGILVNHKSQLADAVCKLLENPSMREEMSENAKDFVRKQFAIEDIVEEWVQLFSNVEGYKCDDRKECYSYDGKQWVKWNAAWRKRKVGRVFPPILFYKYLIYGCRRVLEKFELI